jgi:hypothetical protein
MALQASNLVIQAAPLPSTFQGTPQDLFTAMIQRMKILSPNGTNFIYTGDVQPSTNVGPWLKDGTQWWVWSADTSQYVPIDISASFTIPFYESNTTPANSTPDVWLQTTADATDTNPSHGDPIGWNVFDGTNWVPFVGIVQSGNTAGRPPNAVEYQQYYDTDISVLIWWERQAWRTVSGVPGDIKFVAFNTMTDAVTQNPGWSVFGISTQAYLGRLLVGACIDAGSNPVTTLTPNPGVPQRAAFSTFGETDGVQINDASPVPYPPQIALWCLVKG